VKAIAMSWARILRKMLFDGARGEPASDEDACHLLAAVLDDGMDALELGAVLGVLEARGATALQLQGYCRALHEHRFRVPAPKGPLQPVVLSTHAGTQAHPNLVALLVLALPRLGVPVLIHGALHGDGRVATAHVLRELGIMPCANLAQISAQLTEHRIAFVPTAVLAPGLGTLLALKSRLGFDYLAQMLAKLLNPFASEALIVVPANTAHERALLREVLCECRYNALLLEATEGEAFANPTRRPQIEHARDGVLQVLFEAEAGSFQGQATLPDAADVVGIARWILSVLDGVVPIPLPIVNQLACCLYGAGYTDDLNQAKAIVAVETGSLIAA
jgi:anthranilate phosphoribosyltransferase